MGFIEVLHGKFFYPFHRFLSKLFLESVDYVTVQSSQSLETARLLLPKKPIQCITGPFFIFHHAPHVLSKWEAQKKIGLHGDIILFFGFIRPYKGLRYLLEAMPLIVKRRKNAKLLIVGEFWESKENYLKLINELKIAEHVRIIEAFVPASEHEPYFRASSVVAIPYITISQSAIIPLAYEFGIPVVATNVGGNRDWITHSKDGYLVPPKDTPAFAEAVIAALDNPKKIDFPGNISKKLEKMSWSDKIEKAILNTEKIHYQRKEKK